MKRQLKLILEIDPKTPGEALAKELRQVHDYNDADADADAGADAVTDADADSEFIIS